MRTVLIPGVGVWWILFVPSNNRQKHWFEDAIRFDDVYRKTTQLCFLKIRVESLVWVGEILSVEVSRVVCVREREEGDGGGDHGAGLTIGEV